MDKFRQLCEDNGWCTFQSVDHTSMIVEVSFLTISLFLGAIILKNFCILLSYRRNEEYQHLFGKAFLRVYQFVLAWLLCSVIKMGINVATYYLFISLDYKTFPTPTWDSPIVILSAVFNLFDELTTFFVIWLIILIPYQWQLLVYIHRFKFLMDHINDINNLISLQSRKLFQRSFKVLKVVKIYLTVRLVQLLGYIVEGLLLVFTDVGCQLPSYSTAIVIGQSVIILFFYLFVFYVAEHTYSKRFVIMKTQDYHRIRIEYSLLIVVLLARILLNSFFSRFATYIIDYQPQINCFDKNTQNNLKRSLFLIFGFGIMQFLPISLVMYIYRPSIHEKYKDQSILKLSDILIDDQQARNSGKEDTDNKIRGSEGRSSGSRKSIGKGSNKDRNSSNSIRNSNNYIISNSQVTLTSSYPSNEINQSYYTKFSD